MTNATLLESGPTTQAPQRGRRWRRPLIVVGLIVALIVTLRLTLLAPAPVRVQVASVSRGVVEETVTNTRAGTVKARRRARLSPETGGRVLAIPHRKGERVAAGAVLLRLDDAMQRAQLDLAREDVRAATARGDEVCLAADLAESELARVLKLRSGGAASDQSVDRLTSERERGRAACRAARATLDQARARQRLTEAEAAKAELHAPFAGVIAEINTELGEWITPSPPGVPFPAVVEILDPASLYVTAPIDEMDAGRVRAGQDVRLSVDSRRGEHFAGRLARVAPYVQDFVQQNRTLEVEATFADAAVVATLLAGTSADVEVILSRRENVLQLPTGALGPGNTVLLVERERLVERAVTPGLRNWRSTEILAGLREGDRVVVVRDSPDIKAGARVVVIGDTR